MHEVFKAQERIELDKCHETRLAWQGLLNQVLLDRPKRLGFIFFIFFYFIEI